jgi:uncharacterized membrane protein YebE (DUF533 family)
VGGLAAIAGLAYAAWTRHQARTAGVASAPAPGGLLEGGFLPAPGDRARADELGLVLVRAMIAAAHADGRLDADERRRLLARIAALDLDARERAELLAEIERPLDVQALVAAARTPAVALEIYAASRLAIDADTPAERAYLELLAARLGLPAGLAEAVHAQLGGEAAPSPVPAAPPRDAAHA